MRGGVLLSGVHRMDLQGTLAASSPPYDSVKPHHPISCHGELAYDQDGFRCPHVSVPLDDERTVHIVNQSIAMLLLELAYATL